MGVFFASLMKAVEEQTQKFSKTALSAESDSRGDLTLNPTTSCMRVRTGRFTWNGETCPVHRAAQKVPELSGKYWKMPAVSLTILETQ